MKQKSSGAKRWTPLALAFLFGCTADKPSRPMDPKQALLAQGQKAYVSHCIACHNIDPKKDGAIGPSIWGSSLELLEAKTLEGKYPPGYIPKRETQSMAPLPFAKDSLPAIHAYLNSNP